MDFDCDFNAPMFVDFQNMDGDHQEQEQAEAYFDVHHPDHERDQIDMKNNVQSSEVNSEFGHCTESNLKSNDSENLLKTDAKSHAMDEDAKNLSCNVSRSHEGTREALRRAVAETIEEISNSPKPKIPERRQTPGKIVPKEAKAKMPSPDRTCSPAVTRWKKAKELVKQTPEVLRKARLEKQMKIAQKESLKQGSGSASSIKTFKERLAQSRIITTSSAPTVVSNVSHNIKEKPIKKQTDSGIKPCRPLHPTQPSPFQFATDSRIKPDSNLESSHGNQAIAVKGNCDPINFQKMLRTYQMPCGSTTSSTTRPQPFKASSKSTESTERRIRHRSAEPSPRCSISQRSQHFNISGATCTSASGQNKTRNASGSNTYMSMAEQVIKFQTGTPDRFRSRPKRRSVSTPQRSMKSNRGRSPSPLRCTLPKTPNLTTRGRARAPNVLSAEEKETQELEQAKQNQFRAREVGEGVPKTRYHEIEKRPLTKPEPFHLTSSGHAKGKITIESAKQEFHAKPLNKKIFDGPIGVPTKTPMPVIVPESPAFALKERLKDRKRPESDNDEIGGKRIIKAKPVPHHGVPVILPSQSMKTTTVEPFSFSERDMMAKELKAKRIEAVLNEEKKEKQFKANPMPNLDKLGGIPEKQQAQPTQAEPFNLLIEKRVEERKRKWEEDVENELKQQREATRFKARPARVLEEESFVPKPSDKPLTEIDSNFQLHSDKRAEEREEYEMRRKNKEAELDAARRLLEERRRHDEELEVQRMRKEAVHKAQPVRHYKPINIQPTDKPVTLPMSPNFTYVERSKRKDLTGKEIISNNTAVEPMEEQPKQNLDDTFDL